ncbi:hypothetical protein D3C80_928480 [compost metagenome]
MLRLVGARAPLGAVATAGRQVQGGEQAVEIVQCSAADQGQRSAQTLMQDVQCAAQFTRHANRLGGLGDIQKGAVDIEKQRARPPALAQPVFELGTR